MSLDLDQVRKVAKLARLEASDADLIRIQQQLSAIFDYVDQVQQLNTEGVEELAHPLPVRNVFRDDTPAASLPVDEALRNAPTRAGNYFGVPAVFDTDEPVSH
jgi:aspartyl-tRNA(Asn)/glutamyl-tRNA(Gln) amidotransferase subunit C